MCVSRIHTESFYVTKQFFLNKIKISTRPRLFNFGKAKKVVKFHSFFFSFLVQTDSMTKEMYEQMLREKMMQGECNVNK